MMCLHFIYFSVRASRTYQWCMLPQKRKFNDEVVQSDQSNLLITQNNCLQQPIPSRSLQPSCFSQRQTKCCTESSHWLYFTNIFPLTNNMFVKSVKFYDLIQRPHCSVDHAVLSRCDDYSTRQHKQQALFPNLPQQCYLTLVTYLNFLFYFSLYFQSPF